jgi:hypothetical protein
MSYESEQENQEGQEGAENAEGAPEEGADDLTAALNGGGEMNFVTETKQPINKGTLIVVGLLIACGALTYFMYVRSGPAEAVAADDSETRKVVESFVTNADQNVDGMRKMLAATEKVVQQFRTDPSVYQVPLTKLATNPFMKEKPKPTEDTRALEHAEAVRLATARANEALVELRLQTIIHRDPKKASCMINNTLYRKGQKITAAEGKVTFTVEEIRPDGVTVTAPAVDSVLKFELKMKQ